MAGGLIGKVAKQAIKKKSRSYTKKKPSKKTRVEQNKAKKRRDLEYDIASEDRAFNSSQYGRLSKKDFKQGRKPPTKKSKDDIPF
tara:strand:- start:346 stop:600 length:255 start_codon:yes stop_codon:yes gene_type:complete